jgi:hypothetical protein
MIKRKNEELSKIRAARSSAANKVNVLSAVLLAAAGHCSYVLRAVPAVFGGGVVK